MEGSFIWWQDQSSQRGKEPVSLSPEHVEVEGADGTTQIHPIDEPEDQAVAEGQSETLDNGAQSEGQAASETPAAPAASTAPAPAATASVPAAPVHNAPAPAPVAPAAVAQAPVTPTAPAAAVVPGSAAATAVAGAGQVQIQFSADCWAQVIDANGKVLLSALKRKGETVDVSGKPPFAVRLGYARGAQITYNGQAVDIAPFTSGETARLKLGQ